MMRHAFSVLGGRGLALISALLVLATLAVAPATAQAQNAVLTLTGPAPCGGGGNEYVFCDSNGIPGEPLTLSGAQSTANPSTAAPIVSYTFTVNGGAPVTSAVSAITVTVPDGNNVITLFVTDSLGSVSPTTAATVYVQPANVAVITGGSRTVQNTDNLATQTVTVDGSNSTTAGIPCSSVAAEVPCTYTWTVNGVVNAQTIATPTFALPDGPNTVSLVVQGSNQVSLPTTVTITVNPPGITVQIAGGSRSVPSSNGLPGAQLTFAGTATSPGRTIPVSAFTWIVTAGGTQIQTVAGTAAPTLSLRDGPNVVTLNVLDPLTGLVTAAVVTITVNGTGTNSPTPLSSIPGLTPNQKAVAVAIEQTCADLTNRFVAAEMLGANPTDFLQQCRALITDHAGGVNVPGLQTALDALSGEQVTSMQRVGLDFADTQFKNLGDRLTELHRNARGASVSGLQIQTGDGSVPLQAIVDMTQKLLGGAAGDDPKNSLLGDRLGIFVNGDLRAGTRDATVNESALNVNDNNLTVGIDYRFTPSFVAGLAFGYGKTTVTATDPDGVIDSKDLNGSLYGSWYLNDWYVDGIASYGHVTYDSSRHILFDSSVITAPGGVVDRTAVGSTIGRRFGVSTSAGYDWHLGGWLLGPKFTVSYTRLDIDAFDESGAGGLDLNFDSQRGESLTARLGGTVSYAINTPFGVVLPHAQLAAVHEFAGVAQAMTAQFAAGSASTATFTISTDAPDRNYFNWSTGVSAQFAHGLAAFIDYQSFAGLASTHIHDITIGMRVATGF